MEELVLKTLSQNPEEQAAANQTLREEANSRPLEVVMELLEIYKNKNFDEGYKFLVFAHIFIKEYAAQFCEQNELRDQIIELLFATIQTESSSQNCKRFACEIILLLCAEIPDGLLEKIKELAISQGKNTASAAINILVGLMNTHQIEITAEMRQEIISGIFEHFKESAEMFIPIITLVFNNYGKLGEFDYSEYCEYFFQCLEVVPPNFKMTFLVLLDDFIENQNNEDFFGERFPELLEKVASYFADAESERGLRVLALDVLEQSTLSKATEEVLSTILGTIEQLSFGLNLDEEDIYDPEYEDQTPRTDAEESLFRIFNRIDSDVVAGYLITKFDELSATEGIEISQYRYLLIALREGFAFLKSPEGRDIFPEIIEFLSNIVGSENPVLIKEMFSFLITALAQSSLATSFPCELMELFTNSFDYGFPEIFDAFSFFAQSEHCADYTDYDTIEKLSELCNAEIEKENLQTAGKILYSIGSLTVKLDSISEEQRDSVKEFISEKVGASPSYALCALVEILRKEEQPNDETLAQVGAAFNEVNPNDLTKDEYKAFYNGLAVFMDLVKGKEIAEEIMATIYERAKVPLDIDEQEISDSMNISDDNDITSFHKKSQNVIVFCSQKDIDIITNMLCIMSVYLFDNQNFDPLPLIEVMSNVFNYPYIDSLMPIAIDLISFVTVSASENGCLDKLIEALAKIDFLELNEYSVIDLAEAYIIVTDAAAKCELLPVWAPLLCNQLIKMSLRAKDELSNTKEMLGIINLSKGKLLFTILKDYQEVFGEFCVANKEELFPVNEELPDFILAGSIQPEAVINQDSAACADFIINIFDRNVAEVNTACLRAFKYLIDAERVPPELIVGFAVKISEMSDILNAYEEEDDDEGENTLRIENPYKDIPAILLKAIEVDNSLVANEEYFNSVLMQLCPEDQCKNNNDYLMFIEIIKNMEVTDGIIQKIYEIIKQFDTEKEEDREVLTKLSVEYLRVEQYNTQIAALNQGNDKRIEKIMKFCSEFPPE